MPSDSQANVRPSDLRRDQCAHVWKLDLNNARIAGGLNSAHPTGGCVMSLPIACTLCGQFREARIGNVYVGKPYDAPAQVPTLHPSPGPMQAESIRKIEKQTRSLGVSASSPAAE